MRASTMVVGFIVAIATISAFRSPCHAGVIDWQFSFELLNGDTGTGVFVTQDTPTGGPYLITSIQDGLLDGNPMALLAPGPPPDDTFNDNLLYASQPLLDGQGLGFAEGGFQWAIWSQGGTMVDSWCNNATLGADHTCTFASDPNGAVLDFTVQRVPEPATLALVISGIIGLALIRRPVRS